MACGRCFVQCVASCRVGGIEPGASLAALGFREPLTLSTPLWVIPYLAKPFLKLAPVTFSRPSGHLSKRHGDRNYEERFQ